MDNLFQKIMKQFVYKYFQSKNIAVVNWNIFLLSYTGIFAMIKKKSVHLHDFCKLKYSTREFGSF